MRLAFLGTPEFAVPALAALGEAGHEIAAVYTQPPRRAGRGQAVQPSPVARAAESAGWPVFTPATLKDPESQSAFAALDLDAAVVVAYGLILPQPILDAPRRGCLNIHASLLPRWRGAAPIQRAIEAGDRETGVTIMQMDPGLDTGPMLLSEAIAIEPDETGGSLHDKLSTLGARLIIDALARLDTLPARPQPADGVTYAPKLHRSEARIDWSQPAEVLERRVRAFEPWPGAAFELKSEAIKVRACALADGSGAPGTVLDDRLTVACGQGALRLIQVQRGGKQVMDADAFLRGFPIAPGTVLE
ncbi:MAG: methionyl-tRNA formyltransferase [Alphaproteobacteria bacterium]|nr:methionyl-tRNA formyltransferase [Alphaproteobacteria bacterium]